MDAPAPNNIGLQLRTVCLKRLVISHNPHLEVRRRARLRCVDRLTSADDWIERVGVWIFPQRWGLLRWSGWNRADRAGKITVHRLDPATHVGPLSYISPEARLPDGRSHLERTADTVIALIRARLGAAVIIDGPQP